MPGTAGAATRPTGDTPDTTIHEWISPEEKSVTGNENRRYFLGQAGLTCQRTVRTLEQSYQYTVQSPPWDLMHDTHTSSFL